MTLFNWRRIGRGVRESSSSPPCRHQTSSHPGSAVRRDSVPGCKAAGENPDLFMVLCQPPRHRSRLVNRVVIHNQKHLLPGLPRQAQETTKKIQKHPCGETLKIMKANRPRVGDGRNHVPCPTCSVAAGMRCQLYTGTPRVPHIQRQLSALGVTERKTSHGHKPKK
jgi:hypothetical protein